MLTCSFADCLSIFFGVLLRFLTPPLRREVKGPYCKNPSGILDWGPASRCRSGPLRISVAAATLA
jgi:hypothetical protein